MLDGNPVPYDCSGGEVLISSSYPGFWAVPFSYLTGVWMGAPILGLIAKEGLVPIFGLFNGLVNGFIVQSI